MYWNWIWNNVIAKIFHLIATKNKPNKTKSNTNQAAILIHKPFMRYHDLSFSFHRIELPLINLTYHEVKISLPYARHDRPAS